MSANVKNSEWVDPDDAPPLDDAFFAGAKRMVAGKQVDEANWTAARKKLGRPAAAIKRPTLNMRVDPDVLTALKASGKGWQTRVNLLLRREVLGR